MAKFFDSQMDRWTAAEIISMGPSHLITNFSCLNPYFVDTLYSATALGWLQRV
jgi:hypothetical protein